MRISNLIRAAVKIAEQNPEELVLLHAYLKRCAMSGISQACLTSQEIKGLSPVVSNLCMMAHSKALADNDNFFISPEYHQLLVSLGVEKQERKRLLLGYLTGSLQTPDSEHYLNPNGVKSSCIYFQSRYASVWVIVTIGVLAVIGSGMHGEKAIITPALFFIIFVAALAKHYIDAFKYPQGCDYLKLVTSKTDSSRLKNTLNAFISINKGLSQNDLLRISDAITAEHHNLNNLVQYFKRKDAPENIIEQLELVKDKVAEDIAVVDEMIFMSPEDRTLYY